MKQSVPGPSRWRVIRDLPKIGHSLVDHLCTMADEYGDTVYLPLRKPTYLIRNPEDVRHILVANPQNYLKTGALNYSGELLGNGLIASEPPSHTRHRRLMQPMFHRPSIAHAVTQMVAAAEEQMERWRDGAEIDLAREIMELTLIIVCRVLFSIDTRATARELGNAFTSAQQLLIRRMRALPIPLAVPTPANQRYLKAIRKINEMIGELIASRRASNSQPNDLLGMLLAARFEDGSRLSDKELRDEVATMLLAGHETVSNHLTWTWYALSQHPDVENKLFAEWNQRLDGPMASIEETKSLTYTDMVVAESLRVYPPAWTVHRKVAANDELPSGLALKPGVELLLSQYVSHRNPRFFSEPEKFLPERWTADFRKSLPAGVYYPFGIGPRYCIGENFARLEASVLLSTIGRRFALELVPGQRIAKAALITLRPRFGMKMRLVARSAARLQPHC